MKQQKANDTRDFWTIAIQIAVLAIGFATVFAWDTELPPRILLMLILVLLVVQFPMLGRLQDFMWEQLVELRKAHGITQTMLTRVLDLLPGGFADDKLTAAEKLAKATKLANQLEELSASFQKGFSHTYETTARHGIDLVISTVGVAFYVAALVGTSALLGWLVSFAI